MKPKTVYFTLGMALLWLAGCTLAPQYSRPAAPVETAWPSGAAYSQAQTAAPGADLPWQEFFTDKELQQVITTALENNRDLRLAALNVKKAQAMYGIQRSTLLPSFDTGAAASKQRTPADLSSSGKLSKPEKYSVDFGVSAWEIDFFGRLQSLKDQALEEYLATEEGQRSARILLISSVAGAYLSLAADRRQLELSASTLAAQQETYDLMKRRLEFGLASALDLRRAQAQVETARGDVARFTSQVAQDQNALDLLSGKPVSAPAAMLPVGPDGIEPCRQISAGLSSEVLLQRPDILAQEHHLKAANANIGAARAAFFPRIVLTARTGMASAELSHLFDSGQGSWTFAPQIVLPIFDARLWSAYDLTQAEKEITLTNYEKAIQTAFKEVADALAVQGTVQDQLDAARSLVEALSEAHRLSAIRYDKGIDSYLSVLDAQRSLYAAQQGLITISLADLATRVKLYAALGGGA